MRALVQRPGRRAHLATATDAGWLTVCDRELPAAGTATREHLWHEELAEDVLAQVCRRCLGPIIAGRVAIRESGPVLLAENETLRAEVGRLQGALRSALETAKAYSDRILLTPIGTFAAAERAVRERRHEQRVDRNLARIGR